MMERTQIPSYSTKEAHFITELRRLVDRTRDYERDPHADASLLRMLRRATYAAYRDCQDLGLSEEARDVVALKDGATQPQAEVMELSPAGR